MLNSPDWREMIFRGRRIAWRLLLAPAVLALTLAAANPASAQGKTSAQCGHEFDQCQAQCNSDFKDDAASRAPCVAKCSGLYAACDAGVAYEKAKPWLEEQAKKTKRFFDELLKEYEQNTPPDPQKKTDKNSI